MGRRPLYEDRRPGTAAATRATTPRASPRAAAARRALGAQACV